MLSLLKVIGIFIFMAFINSCVQESNQIINNEKTYRLSGIVFVNDKLIVGGIGTVPRKEDHNYLIKIKESKKIKYVQFKTSHRHVPLELNVSEYTYRYIPLWDVERETYSDLLVDYVLEDGKRFSAFISFENDLFKGDGVARCNGVNKREQGHFVCQGLAGTEQALIPDFDSEISSKCNFTKYANGIKYNLERDYCVYIFKNKNSEKMIKLITYGYDDIVLREN